MRKKKIAIHQKAFSQGAPSFRQTHRGRTLTVAEDASLPSSNLLILTGRLTSPSTYHRSNGEELYRFHLAPNQRAETAPLTIPVSCSLPSLHRIACQLQPGDPIVVVGTLLYSQTAGQQPCLQMLAYELHQHHIHVEIRRVES